jgi:hypothetical protein
MLLIKIILQQGCHGGSNKIDGSKGASARSGVAIRICSLLVEA